MTGHLGGQGKPVTLISPILPASVGLRGGHDAHRCRRDDGVEIGVALDQALRLAIGLVGKIVPIDHGHQIDARIVGQHLAGFLDPDVLVGRGCRGRKDGDLTTIGQMVGRKADDGAADQLVGRRVEVHGAPFGCNARSEITVMPFHGAAARHHRVRIVGGNGDGVDLLGDELLMTSIWASAVGSVGPV